MAGRFNIDYQAAESGDQDLLIIAQGPDVLQFETNASAQQAGAEALLPDVVSYLSRRQAAISGGNEPIIVSCDECITCDPSCEC